MDIFALFTTRVAEALRAEFPELDPDLLTLDVSGLTLRVAAPCGPVGRALTLRDRALAA